MAAMHRLRVHTTQKDPIESLMTALELNLRNHKGAEPLMTHIVKVVDEAGERLAETSVEQVAEFTRRALEQIKLAARTVSEDLETLQEDPSHLRRITEEMNRDMKQLQSKMATISPPPHPGYHPPVQAHSSALTQQELALEQLSNDIANGELSHTQVTAVVGNLQILALETTRALDEITPREVETFASFALALGKATVSVLSDVANAALEQSRDSDGPTIERLPSEEDEETSVASRSGKKHPKKLSVADQRKRANGLFSFAIESSLCGTFARRWYWDCMSKFRGGYGFEPNTWQRFTAQCAAMIAFWWIVVLGIVFNVVPCSIVCVVWEYYFPHSFARIVELCTIIRVIVMTQCRIVWRSFKTKVH